MLSQATFKVPENGRKEVVMTAISFWSRGLGAETSLWLRNIDAMFLFLTVSKGALNGMDLTCKLLVRDIGSSVREKFIRGFRKEV